ncbi:thermonuclease family protein [Oceanobacillus oncorhynchi]|uniref:thermonuclease family protein n=1 Tax=Oceanobacillus oncorhynchi TaxID=545501 RepID=UPI0018668E84|nr:thermonuclease family protein [Oceanobacillus oncorhynchi]
MNRILFPLFPLFLLTAIILLGFTDIASKISLPNIGNKLTFLDSKDQELTEKEAVIIRVVDGDTVIIVDSEGREERVRLLLIDTPESIHPNKEEEPFAKEASDYAKAYFDIGQRVILERGNPERDNYDRLLAYIWVEDINFNQHMIEQGFARVTYIFEPNTKYLDNFKAAEAEAKDKGLNIWSIDGYVTNDGFNMSVVE